MICDLFDTVFSHPTNCFQSSYEDKWGVMCDLIILGMLILRGGQWRPVDTGELSPATRAESPEALGTCYNVTLYGQQPACCSSLTNFVGTIGHLMVGLTSCALLWVHSGHWSSVWETPTMSSDIIIHCWRAAPIRQLHSLSVQTFAWPAVLHSLLMIPVHTSQHHVPNVGCDGCSIMHDLQHPVLLSSHLSPPQCLFITHIDFEGSEPVSWPWLPCECKCQHGWLTDGWLSLTKTLCDVMAASGVSHYLAGETLVITAHYVSCPLHTGGTGTCLQIESFKTFSFASTALQKLCPNVRLCMLCWSVYAVFWRNFLESSARNLFVLAAAIPSMLSNTIMWRAGLGSLIQPHVLTKNVFITLLSVQFLNWSLNRVLSMQWMWRQKTCLHGICKQQYHCLITLGRMSKKLCCCYIMRCCVTPGSHIIISWLIVSASHVTLFSALQHTFMNKIMFCLAKLSPAPHAINTFNASSSSSLFQVFTAINCCCLQHIMIILHTGSCLMFSCITLLTFQTARCKPLALNPTTTRNQFGCLVPFFLGSHFSYLEVTAI